MAHFSEIEKTIIAEQHVVDDISRLPEMVKDSKDVCVVRLPCVDSASRFNFSLQEVDKFVIQAASLIGKDAVFAVIGEIIDLVRIESSMPTEVRYQHWVAVKRTSTKQIDNRFLPNEHFGILLHTHYKQSLKHTKTRIRYTYCPTCDKTTKDYGGKKHTYHAEGTLISDVWRDISCDLEGDISPLLSRLADLFSLEAYQKLVVFDCSNVRDKQVAVNRISCNSLSENPLPTDFENHIIQGDCIEELKKLPDNSIDFAFADPPYNLRKQYLGYSDDLEVKHYFEWCDEWITEIARVLKPGRTFSLLNIPLWSVRHFLFAETVLDFQSWIVWDALSFPVRLIMPAHYTILCFSKGEPRELPGLIGEAGMIQPRTTARTFDALRPLADGYCLRSDCIDRRLRNKVADRGKLTDLWTDIHRLKHNSRRVDHPCQLPPQLMYRLIALFTKPDEIVLDCFNGAGTSTLAAHQLKRRYVGVEASAEYCAVAMQRHQEILEGIDPFRKEERVLTAKNSPVARLPKQKYKVSKKTLQLEVKQIAAKLGHMPTRDEVIQLSNYPIEYYDNYFVSWGEVCAAARTTGMIETRVNKGNDDLTSLVQLSLFERKKSYIIKK